MRKRSFRFQKWWEGLKRGEMFHFGVILNLKINLIVLRTILKCKTSQTLWEKIKENYLNVETDFSLFDAYISSLQNYGYKIGSYEDRKCSY